MSDSQEKPWSDDPNAPEITYDLYFTEKAWFAGNLIASLLYGTPGHPRPSTHAHSVCPVDSRDRHHCVLPMYGRAVQPCLSQGGAYQVGTRILRCDNILACDRRNHDAALHPVAFLR